MTSLEKLTESIVFTQQLESFFGEDAYKELTSLLEGNDHYEIKGMKYWKDSLENTIERITLAKFVIQKQLDEKRSMMAFILTLVTGTALPIQIMTGYFGQNFENMWEMQPISMPQHYHFPSWLVGIQLEWFCLGVIYFTLLLFFLHYRILYSAT